MKIFVVTDNRAWFKKIDDWRSGKQSTIEIFCSPKGVSLFTKELENGSISSIDLKSHHPNLIRDYDVGISCHCKQIFPAELVSSIKCFNIHPGLNPYNRGWFPQVFSILNGLPVGATIHEMDEKIDHGFIVASEKVEILDSDTSRNVYDKIIEAEFRLFDSHIDNILAGNYCRFSPKGEGNYNSISDFKKLCQIDLDERVTFRGAINYLRAMTFDGYNNAYFYDSYGKKVYVSINISSEE